MLKRIAVVALRHPFGGLKLIQNLRLRRCFFCFLVLAQASLARPENKKTT
jgi:hypothetical protein